MNEARQMRKEGLNKVIPLSLAVKQIANKITLLLGTLYNVYICRALYSDLSTYTLIMCVLIFLRK